MREPLTLKELEQYVCCCDDENCDNRTLFFHGACHPGDAVDVLYTKGAGFLVIRCNTCDKLIAEVAVARLNLPTNVPPVENIRETAEEMVDAVRIDLRNGPHTGKKGG